MPSVVHCAAAGANRSSEDRWYCTSTCWPAARPDSFAMNTQAPAANAQTAPRMISFWALTAIRARKLPAITGSVLARLRLPQEQMWLGVWHDCTFRLCRFGVGRNPWPIERLEAPAIDAEPDHLLVQCASWNL